MSQQLSKLRHCSYSLQFHLVLCTKYRRQRCITHQMLNRLHEIFVSTLEKWEGRSGGVQRRSGSCSPADIGQPKNTSLLSSSINLKTVSSRLLRKDFGEHLAKIYRGQPIFWSRSYCILSCAAVRPTSVLKQYIQQQAEKQAEID